MTSVKLKQGFEKFQKIRFTDNGVISLGKIPKNWSIFTIKELKNNGTIIEFQDGNHGELHPKKKDFVEVGKPFLTATQITSNGQILLENCNKLSETIWKKLRIGFSQAKDVLFTHNATVGRVAVLPENFPDSIVGTSITYYRLNEEKINRYFFSYVLNSNFIKKQYGTEMDQSTRQQFSILKQAKLKIPFPLLDEQKKIASILSSIDDLILSYSSTIEETQKIKKGLAQTLLTKGIDHKKFKKVKWLLGKEIKIPEDWEFQKIGDVFKLKSGSTPSRTKPEFFEGGISWATSTDLNRSKISSTLEKITKEGVKDANLTILPKGTFLIATYGLEAKGTRGKCGILEIDATCNQACMAFLPSDKMTSEFLFYFYLYFGEKIIFSIAQGTKQQNISSDTVKKVKLPIPPLNEQERITKILSEMDSKLFALESKKSMMEKIKKGLMQKLLTGQIRIKI